MVSVNWDFIFGFASGVMASVTVAIIVRLCEEVVLPKLVYGTTDVVVVDNLYDVPGIDKSDVIVMKDCVADEAAMKWIKP